MTWRMFTILGLCPIDPWCEPGAACAKFPVEGVEEELTVDHHYSLIDFKE